jgi:hypothetical protein
MNPSLLVALSLLLYLSVSPSDSFRSWDTGGFGPVDPLSTPSASAQDTNIQTATVNVADLVRATAVLVRVLVVLVVLTAIASITSFVILGWGVMRGRCMNQWEGSALGVSIGQQ